MDNIIRQNAAHQLLTFIISSTYYPDKCSARKCSAGNTSNSITITTNA
jgi:hypothetical protein